MRSASSRFIEPEYRALFWPLLSYFLVFGASFTIVGALLPKILVSFHWSYTAAGVVLGAGSVGYASSTLSGGLLIERLGPKVVLTMGLCILSASLYFFGSLSSVVFNFAMSLLIGMGQGTLEVVVNSSLVRMERKSQSHLMSFSHAAFSVGAIGGPVAVAFVLSRGLEWQTVYHVAAAVTLVVAVVGVALPFHRIQSVRINQNDRGGLRPLLRYPILALAFALLLVYVGLESGISNWISEYYVKTFGTPIGTGAFMVSLFWFGIFTGRILVPVVYRGPRQAETLLLLGLLYTVSLLLALFMPGPIPAAVFFYLTSLGCSAIYPLVMTLLGRYFEKGQSVAVGFAATGGGIGSFVIPVAMSGVAQTLGLKAGFVVYLLMGVVLLVLVSLVRSQVRARDPIT